MKNNISITLAAILIFIFFLLVKLPASQLVARINLPDGISLGGISGTLWEGHADQIIYQGLALNNVNWQLDFLPLLIGNAAIEVNAGSVRNSEQISIKGSLVLNTSGVRANDLTLFAPTPLLMAQVQLPIPVDAAGRAKVVIEELNYTQSEGCIALQGQGSWLNAGVAGLNGQVDLGNFEAALSCENGPIRIITEANNSLNLAATAEIQHSGKFSVNGQFKVSDTLPDEVHQAAKFFGNPDAQGFYQIKL